MSSTDKRFSNDGNFSQLDQGSAPPATLNPTIMADAISRDSNTPSLNPVSNGGRLSNKRDGKESHGICYGDPVSNRGRFLQVSITCHMVLFGFCIIAYPQQGDLRLSGPPSEQGACCGATGSCNIKDVRYKPRLIILTTLQRRKLNGGIGNKKVIKTEI
ncbi:hypothetical protein PoB_001296100 [Plakobranchus ocellatus]|uniref:Uncharacterized protein n=1 Tax=Plakobranchus ocellatus TaxID=259542 RepID=A0AAV3YVP6_9GAST|nr:hypothetical protein PoB_001296100 [Plakobranchus ocellatus]